MADIQFDINLDLVEKYVPAENVTVVQEDFRSVKFLFTILNREQPVDLTDATDIVVSFVKPDGHLVLQNDATLVNGKVELVANPQAFTYVGKTYFQVQYKIGSSIYNTRQAFLWVEKGHTSCQTVSSTDFAPMLDQAIQAGQMLSGIDLQALIDSKVTAENAQADVDALELRVGALEVTIVGLDSRVDALEATSINHETRIDSLEASIPNLDPINTAITALQAKDVQQDGRIGANELAISEVKTKNTQQDTAIAGNATAVANLQAKDVAHETRMTAIENKNLEQDDRLSAVETKNTSQDTAISALQGSQSTQDTKIAAIEAKNTQQDTAISANAASITTVDNKVVANKTAQDTINTSTAGSIANHTNRIETLEADSTTDNARITNLEMDNSSNKTRISTMEGAIGVLNSDINALQGSDAIQNADIAAIKTKNIQQDTAISDNTAAITANKTDADAKITGLTTRVGTAETDIAGLKTKDTQQDTRMSAIENKNDAQDTRMTAIEVVNVNQDDNITNLTNRTNDMANNILLSGGNLDGISDNISAFNTARLINRKSDYYGLVYFPNNEVGNAVYYFSTSPFLDKTIIMADPGVKLSFPSTNGVSFKKVIFKDDITIISRDRNCEGKMYRNDYSKTIYSTLSENPVEIGLKNPKFKAGTDYIFTNYFSDGSATTPGSISFYDNTLKDTFKSSDISSPTNTGKYLITEMACSVGNIYNCAFKSLAPESNVSFREGILCSKDNDNFIFYSLDINKNLYKGIRNGSWTETVNNKYTSNFTDAYSAKEGAIMSVRIISLSILEFYVNGVMVERVNLPFEISKVGFGINFVNSTGSGVLNQYWGKITYGESLKSNSGNPLNVIAFGDSITFGESSISWAEYLPTFVEGQRGISKLSVTNKAVSGNTSSQQLSVMQATDLTPYDSVLILIGTNDIQGNVAVSTFSSNLQSMITLAKSNGRNVIVGIPHMWISQELTGQGFTSSNYNKGTLYRAEIMKLVAINEGCYLADTLSEMGRIGVDNHKDLLRDNLHPNVVGEILLARCFARSLISSISANIEASRDNTVISPPIKTLLTLQNEWVNLGSGYGNAAISKTREGTVSLEGIIKGGIVTTGTVITVLPDGYRPKTKIVAPVLSNNSGVEKLGGLEINPNGNVTINIGVANTWVNLSGITFVI